MKNTILKIIFLLVSVFGFSQTPEADLLVVVHSVNTTAEMNTLAPESGSLIYNTADTSLYVYNGTIWEKHKSDGSETYLVAGTNITITGSGTTIDPYVVNTNKVSFTTDGNDTYTFSNGVDPDVSFSNAEVTTIPDSELSFAYSMRRLYLEYTGPLIKLRRSSDNEEEDFYAVESTDLIDIAAINTWAGTDDLYVTTWYDQSNQNRHAVQTDPVKQPQFIADASLPYLVGSNGPWLEVQASVQVVTNAGKEGSVLTVATATTNGQFSFGVNNAGDRWSAHISWQNNQLYFDPGNTNASSPRNFLNTANINVFRQYSLVRGLDYSLVRVNQTQELTSTVTSSKRTTLTDNFAILSANNGNGAGTNKYTEFVMYNTDISTIKYNALEEDQISYWGL